MFDALFSLTVSLSSYKTQRSLKSSICSRVTSASPVSVLPYTGWAQTSNKPLSRIIIQAYQNPPLRLDSFHQFRLQNEHKNMMSVLNILCVTYLVTSSLAVFEAAIRVKSTNMIKSCLITKKKKNMKINDILK